MSLRLFRGLLKGSITPRNIPNSAKKSAAAFWQTPHFSTTAKMSSVGGAGLGAGLYAVVSNPSQVLSQPEEAAAKAHHLKNGKGFTNPWESYTELTPFTMLWGLFMYVFPSSLLCISTNAPQAQGHRPNEQTRHHTTHRPRSNTQLPPHTRHA
jgi:hypothetical protein